MILKKLTLENPKACRRALLCSILILILILVLLFIMMILNIGNRIILSLCFFAVSLFTLIYSLEVLFILSYINIVEDASKRNFEVKVGKKIYKQDFFEKEYHMNLIEFIRSNEELGKAHKKELRSIYNIMENDSIRMESDALYYKSNNKLLEVIYEIDESNPLLLHIDRETATWSYAPKTKLNNYDITMTKAKRREIFAKLESYLKDRNYRFDYRVL